MSSILLAAGWYASVAISIALVKYTARPIHYVWPYLFCFLAYFVSLSFMERNMYDLLLFLLGASAFIQYIDGDGL